MRREYSLGASPDPRRLFLDLDGPLLDVSGRYHRLHQEMVLSHGGTPLPAAEYWEAKRERVPEGEILERTGLSPEAARAVEAARHDAIESRSSLRLDRLWPWTLPTLEALARLAPLVLVTVRRHPGRLRWQLRELGLSGRFARIVCGAGDGTPEAKAHLLRAAGLAPSPGAVLVGDTEVDVESGRALGLTTIALTCGIRSAARLAAASPDLLLADLREVPRELAALGWGEGGHVTLPHTVSNR